MGKLIFINDDSYIKHAMEFSELVRNNEVTHGIIAYCLEDGTIEYRILGVEHSTYIVGLMEKVKIEIINESTKWEN